MEAYPAVLTADLLLIGIAIGLNLLLVGHLAAARQFFPVTVAALLFCLTIPIKLLLYSPAVEAVLPGWTIAFRPFADLHCVFFWFFALTLFNDRFRWRAWHGVPIVVVLGLSLAIMTGYPEAVYVGEIGVRAINLVLLLHIITLALRRFDGDLVDERRRFRVALALGVALFAVTVTVMQLTTIWGGQNDFSLFYAIGSAVLSFIFILWLTTVRTVIVMPPRSEKEDRFDTLSPADMIELKALNREVGNGVCLEPGLTIGGLADRLSMPEHRLRRIINKGLGYRNFSAFLNDYRIEEAKRRLADPARAREQIIQHAYALGYSSLAPFNRAFRDRVGISPSEFRSEALAVASRRQNSGRENPSRRNVDEPAIAGL